MAEVRLIDANALKRDLIDNWAFYSVLMKNALERQPTISPDSIRPKGWWIEDEDDMTCPNCGKVWNYCDNDTHDFDFCPKCGADMREDKT